MMSPDETGIHIVLSVGWMARNRKEISELPTDPKWRGRIEMQVSVYESGMRRRKACIHQIQFALQCAKHFIVDRVLVEQVQDG